MISCASYWIIKTTRSLCYCLIVYLATVPVADTSLYPVGLRCEYRINPQGIDNQKPRLIWILKSDERDQKQSAFQILVAGSKAKLETGIGDLWDSGKILSDQSIQVVYGGVPLLSGMRCFWKVRVWDNYDRQSQWSSVANWSMGLLSNSEWHAKWISYDTSALNRHPELHLSPCPYFRKEFNLDQNIRKATVYVSALGLYELYITGQRIGRDYFTPGWTNYRKRVYYLSYDVSELLRPGQNAIGAILANGWYAGYVGFAPNHLPNVKPRAYYGEVPALLIQLEIEYSNGSRKTIITDDSWKASTGPILESDIQMGELYDARFEIPGWNIVNFNDRAWEPVQLNDLRVGKLEAYPTEPVRVITEIKPIEMTEPKPGIFVFNLGQNIAGRIRLKVRGKAGTKIVIRHAEMLHPDGTIMTENLRSARATDTFILKGNDSVEIWEPRFTYHGFQYVEIKGFPGQPGLETVTGIVLHSAMDRTGFFSCSDPLINRLYSNILWTQRSNFFEIPTDCPQRDERMGWSGDAQVFIHSAAYNMNVAPFFSKWLLSLVDDQRPSGAFPDYAPMPFLLFEPSPGWMDAGIICPYTIYKVYGDTHVIDNNYQAMTKFMAYLIATSQNNLRTPKYHSFGDWLSIDERTSDDLIATAFFAHDARLMSEMAAAVGLQQEAEKYAALYEKIKKAFNNQFVTPDGRILGDTQSGYAMALNMDLLFKDQASRASKHLVESIRRRNWHLSTGFLGLKHLLPALTRHGHNDIAYRLLLNTTYPSWGYSIANGATTIWERWNAYTHTDGFANPEMNSFNHYAFGAVGEWLFRFMAGIDTQGAGFKHILIHPHPGGGLTRVTAIYDSIRGRIQSDWAIRRKKFFLICEIPANTTATVYLPTINIENIRESNRRIDEVESVRLLRVEQNFTLLAVGSGRYYFQAQLSPVFLDKH